jgi:hypothetical protein
MFGEVVLYDATDSICRWVTTNNVSAEQAVCFSECMIRSVSRYLFCCVLLSL